MDDSTGNVPSADLLSATDLAVMSSAMDQDELDHFQMTELHEDKQQDKYQEYTSKQPQHQLQQQQQQQQPFYQQPMQNHPIYLHPFPMPRKICSNCGSISTPSWRRCPEGRNLLCNACGLYQKLHRRPRPLRIREDGSVQVIRNLHSNNPQFLSKCESCGCTESPNWISDGKGQLLCAACCSLPDELIQRIFPDHK